MKLYRTYVMGILCALSLSMAVSAADTIEASDEAAEVDKTTKTVQVDPSIQLKNLDAYYITKGSTYDKITQLLQSLPQHKENSYYRIDKNLTGNYFYHVCEYASDTHYLVNSYFVAKNQSCVWQINPDTDAELVFGNAEDLLKKTEVVVYPKRIPVGSYGIVRVHVPGKLPYDIKMTSLNTNVVTFTDKLNLSPVETGKTDIIIDLKIGDSTRTITKEVIVVDTADKESDHRSVGTSIGIGIGWGGGHGHGHGHRHGGIGIGIGPWW